MQKIIILYLLSLSCTSFCADDEADEISLHHKRVAINNMQLHTTEQGKIILRALGRARLNTIAQACTDYITGLIMYNSSKLAIEDKQKLIQALQSSRERIVSDEQTGEQLFKFAHRFVSASIELLPELQPYAHTFRKEQQELLNGMADDEMKQYDQMWSEINQELKEVYLMAFDKGLSEAQKTLPEDASPHDCTIS